VKLGLLPAYQTAPVETAAYAGGLARLAEELGFESVWAAEHVVMPADYASRYPYSPTGRMPIPDAPLPDPLLWLAWLAAASERLRVGTAVAILPEHNPLVFAKAAASLDHLSGGRLLLGVGVGWLREEAEAVGTPFAGRGRRCDEAIEAMRALWTRPVASYRGRTLRFENVKCSPRPLRPEGVPILVGGHSPAAARRAGRLGDGFLPLGGGLEELAGLRKTMEEAARAAGRDPAAIEITRMGPPDPAELCAARDAGVSRWIVYLREPDLEASRRVLEPFCAKVAA
jgi:probable F420-dependent oxidoreductase